MWTSICAAILVVAFAEGRQFNNPVIDNGDYPDPGAILHEGVYYVVTTTNNDKNEKYPIHTSTDLQNWELVGYVFNPSNFPVWSRPTFEFWAPEIHKIGNQFMVYFTARVVDTDLLALGVASAPHPAGPYTPQDQPLLIDPAMWEVDSTIIQHDGNVQLCWVGASWIRVRNLTDDGLSFKDDFTALLFNPDLPFEGATTEGPWYEFRNGYHYIFYSGNDFCTDTYSFSVARSNVSTIGPYEKLGEPILTSDDRFKGPGHGSIVRDVDGEGWVFVHHAWKAGFICGDNYRLMFSTSMEWGDDDWPKKMFMT